MANIADAQNSFEAGEIDVIALARADIEAYSRAVTSAVNFDLLPQGPARKRFGGRVFPLSPSLDTALLIGGSQNAQPILIAIQGDGTIRTIRANNANYGDLIDTSLGALSVDLASAYWSVGIRDRTDRFSFDFTVFGPVSGGAVPCRSGGKFGSTIPTQFEQITAQDGLTFPPSANSGAGIYAVTGSGGYAVITQAIGNLGPFPVGSLVSFRPFYSTFAAPWQPNVVYTAGDFITANGNLYECTTGGTSGTTAPNNQAGVGLDATVEWAFRSREMWVGYVLSYNSGTGVTEINWSSSQFGDGHPIPLASLPSLPAGSCFIERLSTNFNGMVAFQDRLVTIAGDVVGFSRVGQPRNFAPLSEAQVVTDDAGFTMRVGGTEGNTRLWWLKQMPNALLVGASDGVYVLEPQNGAVSAISRPQLYKLTSFGAAPMLPTDVAGELVYVGTDRRTLYSIKANNLQPNAVGTITMPTPYLFAGNEVIQTIASANRPHPVLLVTSNAGSMRVGTYTGEQRYGWQRNQHEAGGFGWKDLVVSRNPEVDFLTARPLSNQRVVQRFFNPGPRSWHQRLMAHLDFAGFRSGNSSGAINVGTWPSPALSSFRIIGVRASDGAEAKMIVGDTSNPAAVTWSRPAGWETLSELWWGWKADTELIGMPLVRGSRNGTGQAKLTSTYRMAVDTLDTTLLEGKMVGQDLGQMVQGEPAAPASPLPLRTGITVFDSVQAPEEYDQRWHFLTRDVFPCTIRGIYPNYSKADE